MLKVYSSKGCSKCTITKDILERNNIPFESRDFEELDSDFLENNRDKIKGLPVLINDDIIVDLTGILNK